MRKARSNGVTNTIYYIEETISTDNAANVNVKNTCVSISLLLSCVVVIVDAGIHSPTH